MARRGCTTQPRPPDPILTYLVREVIATLKANPWLKDDAIVEPKLRQLSSLIEQVLNEPAS